MATYRDIVEIILIRENELGQRTELHFPVLAECDDKAVAMVSTEVIEGKKIPMAGMTFVELDRLHAIRLEVLADIGRREKAAKKVDLPPMYWMHSLYLEDGAEE